MRSQPGKFTLSGDGLCIGYDSDDAVSQGYKTPGKLGREGVRTRSSSANEIGYDVWPHACASITVSGGSCPSVTTCGIGPMEASSMLMTGWSQI